MSFKKRGNWPPKRGNPNLRTAEDWRALAVKRHMCVQCLHNQHEIWGKECPKCQANDSREFMPSRAELNRASQLILMQRAGKISRLRFHPRFDLKVNSIKVCAYEADAEYFENGKMVVEDTKPDGTFIEPVAKLKIALFEAIFGVKVKLYRGS